MYREFVHQVGPVGIHRLCADPQFGGHGHVGMAPRDALQHLQLPLGQINNLLLWALDLRDRGRQHRLPAQHPRDALTYFSGVI